MPRIPTTRLSLTLVLTLLVAASFACWPTGRAAAPPQPSTAFSDHVRPFLVRHCQQCHGDSDPEGGFRIEQLTADVSKYADRELWLYALKRIESGEMPPKSKPRPTPQDIAHLKTWLNTQVKAAIARRVSEGRTALRRLNRVEYENTVRDLLGVVVDLKEQLPEDSSSHGFDNVSEAQHFSSFLMERYLETADKALNLAIANLPQPPKIEKRYSLKETHTVRVSTENVFLKKDDGTVVCFSSSAWNSVVLSPFYPPDRGHYKIRLNVSAIQSNKKPVALRIDAGPMLMATKSHLVGFYDAQPDKSTTIEFVDHFEARSTIRIHPQGLASAQTVSKIGADKYEGPGLAVHWVEVTGPLHDTWPPASHRRIFGDLEQKPAPVYNYSKRVEVVSKDTEPDARRILRDFASRAFRRDVSDDEVKPFVKLVQAKLAEKRSFEQAMRAALLAILVSSDFLFLREKPGKLDDFALASRLSYFLWSTMPDEELLTLARKKQLGDEATLRLQVERMLKSPKAKAFTENFVDQWLGLRDIDFTEPSHLLYPEYDSMLRAAMMDEAHLFFDEVLKNDLSLTNFVASDFAMLNERLARHYGIEGVRGHSFRKVNLPPNSHRGGVMTMAAVLKVTANGTTTSPVTRGAWVLDRILGTPPSPPPSGVAAVEPDIRGATTIRQQLAKHRDVKTCASCHTKIDPPGFALESYDVIGGWRDNYRTLGRGKPVTKDGRRMHYLEGPKVDPGDEFDGQKFADIDAFKDLLLRDKDRLARALTTKLLIYATGGSPETVSREEIEAIVAQTRTAKYGLRALVHEVVRSRAFCEK